MRRRNARELIRLGEREHLNIRVVGVLSVDDRARPPRLREMKVRLLIREERLALPKQFNLLVDSFFRKHAGVEDALHESSDARFSLSAS